MLDRKDAGERVHTEHGDEPGGVLTGVGRVGEGDVVLPAMESFREPERVDLVDGRAVLHRERLDVGLEAREREAVQLDEVGRRRAARQRLEAERPRAREQVEHPGAAERALQDREPRLPHTVPGRARSEEHTSELQSHSDLVCRLLLEKKKTRTSMTGVTLRQSVFMEE